MVCGIKWKAKICEKTAERICRKLNLTTHRGYRTEKENEVAGRENSFRRSGRYKCFVVEVEKNGDYYFLTVRGSLHKYYHGNNSGAFSGYEILEAKRKLSEYLEIEQSACEIYTLEIGINIQVWFKVYDYLKNNLIQHKKERFMDMRDSRRFGFVAVHEDYLIKVYRKQEDELRYEVKMKSKKIINEAGIYTLADINELHINKLAGDLVEQWKEIITRDGLNIYDKNNRISLLTVKEREKLLEFTSLIYVQSYHQKLKEAKSKTEWDRLRQEAYRLKKCCIELIKKYGNNDHDNLYTLILEGVEKFKDTWNEDKGGMSHFPTSISSGKCFNRSIEEIVSTDKQSISKIKNNMTVPQKKSNKQVAIEKREQKKLIFNSFISKLKDTLTRLEQKEGSAGSIPMTTNKAAA